MAQGELFTRLQEQAGEALRQSEAERLNIAPEEVELDSLGFIYTNRRENGRMYGLRGVQSALAVCAHHIMANPSMPEEQIAEVTIGTLQQLHARALEVDVLAKDNPEAAARVFEIYNRGRVLLGQRAAHQVVESVESGDI